MQNSSNNLFFKTLRRAVPAFLALSMLCATTGSATGQDEHLHPIKPARPVLVEFFFQPGCDECAEIQEHILPQLTDMFGDSVVIKELSIYESENFLRLTALKSKLNVESSENASAVVDTRFYIGGMTDIRNQLAWVVGAVVEERAAGIMHEIAPEDTDAVQKELNEAAEQVILARLKAFTPLVIALAGLADGFNPCAFATIILFASLLTVSKRGGKTLLVTGTAFCAAVFLTYLAIGFGAFGILRAIPLRKTLADIIKWTMVLLLGLLAFLSFRDAFKYKRSGSAENVTLRLPDSLKNRIHAILREKVSSGKLVTGGLAAGFLVTLIESVCTGQLYVPTLVYLAGDHVHYKTAWALLLLYNIMFIAPLILVLAAAYYGTKSDKLARWSRRNVTRGKVFLGIVFALLAVLMALT